MRTTNAQLQEMMVQMQAQMAAQTEVIAQLQAQLAGQTSKKSTKTKKSAPKKPELVEFRKNDGTTKLVSPKQAAAWEKYRSRELTEGQKTTITLIRESKTAEIERTRELEKALGVPMNSLKNTACTCEEARALGWKGTKAELKAIKAQIRAK